MNRRDLAISLSKALTIGGVVFGAYILLSHLTLVLTVSIVGFVILYNKKLLDILSGILFFVDKYVEKLMFRLNPIIVMEKHLKTLKLKKNKIQEKMVSIKGKTELLNNKIVQLKKVKDDKVKSAIETLEKSVEYLNLHHEKLDVLTKKINNKIQNIDSNMEIRKLTHSAMVEALSVARMSRDLLEDKDIVSQDNIGNEIDNSLSQMRGEMEELLRQVNQELALKI